MLTQREILFAVRNVLKGIRDVPVYLHEVRERYQTPCFALTMTKTTTPLNENAGTFRNEGIIGINYIAVKGTDMALEMFSVQDEIISALWRGLGVADRYLHFEEFEGGVDGAEKDILFLEISYSYIDKVPVEDDSEIIGNINAEINFKDWQIENGGKLKWQN